MAKALKGIILAGEFDGVTGLMRHDRLKSAKIAMRTLSLLSLDRVSQASVQHWACLFCFVAGFRRPLFAAVQDILAFICSFEDEVRGRQVLPTAVSSDDVMIAASLLVLARQKIRAKLHPQIAISDVSEEGGASAEGSHFLSDLDKHAVQQKQDEAATLADEEVPRVLPASCLLCAVCLNEGPCKKVWGLCAADCFARVCSFNCFKVHRSRPCRGVASVRTSLAVVDLGSESWRHWAAVVAGHNPIPWTDFKRCSEVPGVVCVSVALHSLQWSNSSKSIRSYAKPLEGHEASREHASLRSGNKAILKIIDVLDFFVVHPCDSWLWYMPAVIALLNTRTEKRSR